MNNLKDCFFSYTKKIKKASFFVTAVTIAFIIILMFFSDHQKNLLQFNKNLVLEWELWRALTGHFIHYTWHHMAMNVAALIFVYCVFLSEIKIHRLILLIVTQAFFISFVFICCFDSPNIFRGLSALVHGLLAYGTLIYTYMRSYRYLIILVMLIGKVIYEQTSFYDAYQNIDLLGEPVATGTHFSGVLVGLFLGLSYLILRQAPDFFSRKMGEKKFLSK